MGWGNSLRIFFFVLACYVSVSLDGIQLCVDVKEINVINSQMARELYRRQEILFKIISH